MSYVIQPLLCVIIKRGSLEKKYGRGDDDNVGDIMSPFCNQLLRRDLAHCYMIKCAKCER